MSGARQYLYYPAPRLGPELRDRFREWGWARPRVIIVIPIIVTIGAELGPVLLCRENFTCTFKLSQI